MKNIKTELQTWMALLVIALSTMSFAARYPDTVWVKVTFYDFKANGTNPNFEACNPGFQAGMIQNYLDAWRKPVFKANKACNYRVAEWFRVSGAAGPDTPSTNFIFDPAKNEWSWSGLVNYQSRSSEWVGPHHSDNDSMTNIVIYDSLPFRIIDTALGMYQYNNQSFFMLDGKGYGNEGKKDNAGNLHNFSFTMEIHSYFTYNGGEVFRFTGDDDVWAFINGQLAMDIGGVHSSRSDSIILDNAASRLNLVKGKSYAFDFFYAERHTSASTIRITTDIFKPKPSQIIVRPDSLPIDPRDTTIDLKDTTITTGQCVKFRLHILDDTLGLQTQYDSLIQWEIFDTMGNAISFDTISEQNRVCVTKAYGCIKIRLTFRDPEDATNIIRDSIQLCVQQGNAHHLVIEGSPLVYSSPRNDNPLNNLTIPASATKDTAFAVLRDAYGNFVSPSLHTEWTILSGSTIVSVANGDNNLGAGIISKLGPSGDAWIIARSTDYTGAQFSDTLHVIVSDIAYDSIRVVTGEGGQKTKISSLVITIGQDSILKVEGHRIDGLGDHGWTSVNATWSLSSTVRSQTPPPVSDSAWNFTPADTGHGTLAARVSSLACSITVWVRPGIPASIGLYPKAGQPGSQNGNIPYLSSVTYAYQAGTVIPLVAKLFDPISVWLSAYETDPALFGQISWVLCDSTGTAATSAMGSLSVQSGHQVFFTPKMAFKTYTVTATFSQGSTRLQASVRIRVTAGSPSHIVIESSADSMSSPNADNPLSRVDIQSSQTSQAVYAVIRDRFGNYVGHADSSAWLSTDTSAATVAAGPVVRLGQATITRVATTNGQTWVVAILGAMTDSVDVRVTSITYDSIKIMVNSNGLKDIDSLIIRTDQDTTLYATGKRSDTRNWTSVAVSWQTITVVTNPAAPGLAAGFTFRPSTPATGKIAIRTIGSGGVTVADTIAAVFLPGLARRLELYAKAGQPLANDKYPDPTVNDTIVAGTTLPFYAKIFDQNGVWLNEYEKNPCAITWRIQELTGNPPSGTLSGSPGYFATFTPIRAYNTLNVIAELGINTTLISDMVKVYIVPSAADHIVIESKPDATVSPNADNPIGLVTFGPTDTVRYAYAVIRDRYGNFIGLYSQGTWQSRDTSLVNARPGAASLGEGVITRKSNAGATAIVVHNADYTLADTATVVLNNITYDSLRIVTTDVTQINRLVVRIDQDTTILVQGKRSDNKQWEYVAADWKLVGSVSVNPTSPRSSSSWTFQPNDTGSGFIIVSMGTSVPDTIRLVASIGLPSRLVLYTGDTMQTTALQSQLQPIDIAAGDTFAMTARVLDINNNWLKQYKSVSAPVFWRIEQLLGNPPSDSLTSAVGYASAFVSTRAYNNVYVIVSFIDSLKRHLYDTVQIHLKPGAAHHLVLEPNANWQVSPNRDNPVDSITITSMSTFARVNAVIRDAYGNFIDYSLHTSWTARDTAVVSVEEGVTNTGEGVIRRITTSGRTVVRAVDRDNPLLCDSVTAIVVSYFYEALRIVVRDSTHVTALAMTTNDDTTLIVQGLRSDTKRWENTSAKWETSGGIIFSPPPPDMSHDWTFYPSVPGNGKIRVTLGNDESTRPDTLSVTFIAGPPNRIQFEIVTPAEDRIAGETIVAVVRISNRTGLVPGTYCYSSDSTNGPAVYQTLLGSGTRPPAVITVDGSTVRLNKFPYDSIKSDECFSGGIDTVRLVLYNAAFTKDSLQQLFVRLNGLRASSEAFSLLPARLAAIRLEDVQGRDLGDSLVLHYPGESKTICAAGYDIYGNKRRTQESCTWTTDGTLHAIVRGVNAQRIYYEASGVTNSEEGNIHASASDTSHGVIADEVFVRIVGPQPRLISALTKDANGNGYLDEITLTFDKKVTIPYTATIDVWCGSTVFPVDSIDMLSRDSGSVFVLYLAEQKTSEPQTAWRPACAIRGIPDVDPIDSMGCDDGAGPVVWKASKVITNMTDRKQDLVTVEFSEPIEFANGNALSVSLVPAKALTVWTRRFSGDALQPINDFLDGIGSISKILDSKTIQFCMSNGNDLTDRHYLSIRTDSAAIADASMRNNTAVDTNQRVAVTIRTEFPQVIQIAPNPSRPTLREERAGVLHCSHNAQARNWVREDQAGYVMTFKVMPFSGSNEKIKAHLRIYDAIGNMVNYADNDDILLPEWRTSGTTVHDMDMYWNGTNQKGMVVAPGIYRVFLFLESSSEKRKLVGTIGVTR